MRRTVAYQGLLSSSDIAQQLHSVVDLAGSCWLHAQQTRPGQANAQSLLNDCMILFVIIAGTSHFEWGRQLSLVPGWQTQT